LYTQQNVKELIDIFIKQVSREIKIDALYLFGSYANGNARKYSDIDLAIVSEYFEGDRFNDKKRLNKFVLSTSIDFEIHPFNTKDFNDKNPFVEEIIKTGIRIV
jgi:uncharacterized protein